MNGACERGAEVDPHWNGVPTAWRLSQADPAGSELVIASRRADALKQLRSFAGKRAMHWKAREYMS